MSDTCMLREISEIPSVIERQLREAMPLYRDVGLRFRRKPPRLVVACARGSSSNAVTYFKYLLEARLGVPLASIGPSIASVYGARLNLSDAVCLSVSQSGGSPDLVALQDCAHTGGADTIALLNVTDSPLGAGAQTVLPMLAGPEQAVAATKSFVASLFALASVIAAWTGDEKLEEAMKRLPEVLQAAIETDWSAAEVRLAKARSIYVIARGPTMGIAEEAALKLKETCRLHAESYSAAEVHHGPIALAGDRFAALLFESMDGGNRSTTEAAERFLSTGTSVFSIGESNGAMPVAVAPHPILQPLCQIAGFYRFVERLSTRLGENPDAPMLLQKVTRTQ